RVIGPTPLTPFSTLSHAWAMPFPTGETIPSPVTTTLRFDIRMVPGEPGQEGLALLLHVGGNVVDRLLDGGDLLGFLVGDVALEFLLECHHQLDVVEGIGAQVLDE